MIKNNKDYKYYCKQDMKFYHEQTYKDRIIYNITMDPISCIKKYIKYLRKEELYYNRKNNKLDTFLYLFYLRKKNKLGDKLGFKIPKNTIGPGLTIYHHGSIIINEKARIGANCILHGNNCIGNDGKKDYPPIIGNNLDLGFGASIIGNVQLQDNVIVGAHALVINSFEDDDITIGGIPAKKLK